QNNLERTSVAVPARAEYTDTKQSLLMHTLAAAALPAPVPKHNKNEITRRTIQERSSRCEFHRGNYQNETKSDVTGGRKLAVWDVDVGGPSGSASKSKPTKWWRWRWRWKGMVMERTLPYSEKSSRVAGVLSAWCNAYVDRRCIHLCTYLCDLVVSTEQSVTNRFSDRGD
ncbi:hypothetical protein V1477_015171, partial [Vespula maculifrons]